MGGRESGGKKERKKGWGVLEERRREEGEKGRE
jgi:hypothetical protein